MTEPQEKRWCYGKMDLLVTEDCSTCDDVDACYDLSFGEFLEKE